MKFPPLRLLAMIPGLLLALTLLAGCESGPRFIFTPGSGSGPTPAPMAEPAEPGEAPQISSAYWVRFQDWKMSHLDLERDLEDSSIPLRTLESSFQIVEQEFRSLRPSIPRPVQAFYEETADGYASLKLSAARGLNRDGILYNLRSVGNQAFQKLKPEAIAEMHQEESTRVKEPAPIEEPVEVEESADPEPKPR